jgi:antitoxin HigA-1
MPRRLRNVTPGEILAEEFMRPLGLSRAALAPATGLAPAVIAALVDGRRAVTAEIDLRLGQYFGLSDGFWLRVQQDHDLVRARRRLGRNLDRITPRAA